MRSYFFNTIFLRFLLLLVVALPVKGFSTNTSFKSNTGILSFGNQTLYYLFPALYFNNESKIHGNVLSLNQEVGFNVMYFSRPNNKNQKRISQSTSFSLEPRWYYKNHKNRNDDGSKSVHFSPFLSLKLNANTPLGFAYIINDDNDNKFIFYRSFKPSMMSMVLPRWGFQGNIANLAYCELGIGIAYFYMFDVDDFTREVSMTKGFLPDLFLRIGFRIY